MPRSGRVLGSLLHRNLATVGTHPHHRFSFPPIFADTFSILMDRRSFSTNSPTIVDWQQESDDEKEEPWKILIEYPARAAWRVSPAMPKDLETALSSVLDQGGRKRKQLRITHEKIIAAHGELALRRERERMRISQNSNYSAAEKKRDEKIEPVFYGPQEALSNFYFRLFPHYTVMKRILGETSSLLGHDWNPRRVLDFGIGSAGSSAASLHVNKDVEWIHGIDPSQTMREGAKLLLDALMEQREESENSIPPRATFAAHLSSESSSTFDLALFSYTATELTHNAATLAAAASLWEKLSPGGIFVMVEPGTPDGFSSVRSVRDMLLDCTQGECHVIAPCTHNGACPIVPRTKVKYVHKRTQRNASANKDLGDDEPTQDDGTRPGFCSFVQTMPSAPEGKGEKFSYLVAQKRVDTKEESHRFANVNVPALVQETRQRAAAKTGHDHSPDEELLQQAVDLEKRFLASDDDALGLELVRGDKNRRTYGRIIHAPKKRKGHILVDSCVAPGRIVRHKISKSMSNHTPGLFTASRKARWGGLWPTVPLLLEEVKKD